MSLTYLKPPGDCRNWYKAQRGSTGGAKYVEEILSFYLYRHAKYVTSCIFQLTATTMVCV